MHCREATGLTKNAPDDAPLLIGVSGIRGVVGRSLNPQVVLDFATAYGSALAGHTVVVSRDGRPSGEAFACAAKSGLLAVGCRVADLGIAATPTCGYYIRSIGASGGIQITASHNPPQWNGLKLFRPEGFIISPDVGRRIADDFRNRRAHYVLFDAVGDVVVIPDPHGPHIDRVVSLVDAAAIRRRKFRIVLDGNHGAGALLAPRLLEMLGCDVQIIGGVPDGLFEHPPEPVESHLGALCSAVRSTGANAGFAIDPDADRLAIVDENGHYCGEEFTLALAIRQRLRQQSGPVVINSSTSRISEDVARSANCDVFRTPVGEVHVAERMIAETAVIGGEGNGGVIDPRVGYGRDSAVAMALVLDLLTVEQRPLSAVVGDMPSYTMLKDKIYVASESLADRISQLRAMLSDGKADQTDGLRIDWPDAWLQVRASNTEPAVRIICEAQRTDRAMELNRVAKLVIGAN